MRNVIKNVKKARDEAKNGSSEKAENLLRLVEQDLLAALRGIVAEKRALDDGDPMGAASILDSISKARP